MPQISCRSMFARVSLQHFEVCLRRIRPRMYSNESSTALPIISIMSVLHRVALQRQKCAAFSLQIRSKRNCWAANLVLQAVFAHYVTKYQRYCAAVQYFCDSVPLQSIVFNKTTHLFIFHQVILQYGNYYKHAGIVHFFMSE